MNNLTTNSTHTTFAPTDASKRWANLRQGSETAFTNLYNHYFPELCRYGTRICGDKELIEDSIQDLFVEIWKTRTCLPVVHSVKYYLFVWLKRKIVRKLLEQRKVPTVRNVLEEYTFEIVFSPESTLIAKQFSEEQQQSLLQALNQLTRRQKEAITLRFYDGFSYEEIATLLSMNAKSVRNIIYRAMLILRKNMVTLGMLLSLLSLA